MGYYYILFENKTVKRSVSYSPSHCRAGTPTINIQSTLHTAPDLCKNVAFAVLFGSSCNSYTVSVQSGMYIHTHFSQYRMLFGRKKDTQQWMRRAKEIFLRAIGSPSLVWALIAGLSPQRAGFNHRLVRMGFVVYEVALGQVYLPILVPCQYHSTTASYTFIYLWPMLCKISIVQ